MSRSDQVRRIQTCEEELAGCIMRAARSSRRPLKVMRRNGVWLSTCAGFLMGAVLARGSARFMAARALSGTMLMLRARRIVLGWLRTV